MRKAPAPFCLTLLFFLILGVLEGKEIISPLDKTWATIQKHEPNLGCRTLMEFILEAAGSSESTQRSPQIESALEDLARMQDRDPTSKTYGNFCWYWHETKPADLNAVEFVVQRAALLKLRYADHLSPKATEALNLMLNLSVEGIRRQKVAVDYTNIYLMKTWNLLALGETLQRPDLSQEGSSMLDQWISFTTQNGITEFLSPTYNGVALDTLGLMANQLSDPSVKERAERILRLYWANMAANWFEPAQRLGGSHARDYDYLTGEGMLDQHLVDAGWVNAKASVYHLGASPVFESATRWLPPADYHRKALSLIPRFVYQKCGKGDTDWASHYVGQHVSIGISGSSQGPEDKPLAINIAGPAGRKTVQVIFVMDGRGDPYGMHKVATGASGHPKAHHLSPLFRAVQSGPDVLFLASWPKNNSNSKHKSLSKDSDPDCLLSHIDFPAEAIVWGAEKPLDPNAASQPVPDNLCFLRMGDVAIGIRFLLAEDTTGKPIPVELVNDGQAYHAKRLTVTHRAGNPGEGRGTVAVAISVTEGLNDAGFAEFRKNFANAKSSAMADKKTIRLTTQGGSKALGFDVDLNDGQVLHSEGTDFSRQIAPFSVNGKEYGAALLGGTSSGAF